MPGAEAEPAWVCPADRGRLTPTPEGAMVCADCGRGFPVEDGIPLFVLHRREGPRPDPLAALWDAVRTRPVDEAAEDYCRTHGCVRSRRSSDWKFFLGVADEDAVLELGAGFGDDTLELGARSGPTIAVVPSATNARIVHRHLSQRSSRSLPVLVLDDLARLPLGDGTIRAIAIEDVAAPGFGLDGAGLPVAAAEWRRVLQPGGTVLIGLSNGLHRLPGLARLEAAVRVGRRPDALNRAVKRSVAPATRGRLGLGRTMRAFARAGFGSARVYAPLPDENDVQLVVPLDEPRVVRYFLDNLVRRNSLAVRAALPLARGLVATGLFSRLVPYYYLIFRAPESR